MEAYIRSFKKASVIVRELAIVEVSEEILTKKISYAEWKKLLPYSYSVDAEKKYGTVRLLNI